MKQGRFERENISDREKNEKRDNEKEDKVLKGKRKTMKSDWTKVWKKNKGKKEGRMR